jgi:hypothetical protein
MVERDAEEAAVPAPKLPSAPAVADADVVLVHGVTPDGNGLQVIRQRKGRLEAGAVRSLRDGQPIHGEVVKLTPRPHFPLICDVEVQLPAPAAALTSGDVAAGADTAHRGPAQVASDLYRTNWDVIWRHPRPDDRLS